MIPMKTTEELKRMLFERLAEIKAGVDVIAYDEQLRIELALLADILEEDIDEVFWEDIEKYM